MSTADRGGGHPSLRVALRLASTRRAEGNSSLCAGAWSSCRGEQPRSTLSGVVRDRIRHTVAFTLVHPTGSKSEADFLEAAERLAAIPSVEAFELLVEVSPKNDYRFGLSMEFASRDAYERYNEHPDHVRFVQERWLSEVPEFIEIDYASR